MFDNKKSRCINAYYKISKRLSKICGAIFVNFIPRSVNMCISWEPALISGTYPLTPSSAPSRRPQHPTPSLFPAPNLCFLALAQSILSQLELVCTPWLGHAYCPLFSLSLFKERLGWNVSKYNANLKTNYWGWDYTF